MYNPWITLGKGVYTDVIVGTFFNIDGWYFHLRRDRSGASRHQGLLPPRQPLCPPGTYPIEGVNYGTSNYYVLIHAEDPTAVYL